MRLCNCWNKSRHLRTASSLLYVYFDSTKCYKLLWQDSKKQKRKIRNTLTETSLVIIFSLVYFSHTIGDKYIAIRDSHCSLKPTLLFSSVKKTIPLALRCSWVTDSHRPRCYRETIHNTHQAIGEEKTVKFERCLNNRLIQWAIYTKISSCCTRSYSVYTYWRLW